MDDPRGELDSHHPKAMHERRARRDWRRRGSRMALGLKSKSAILLTTSPLRVVLFTWSPHSQSIDGSIGPSGACKTRKDVAAIALTVSERSEPIILQILIEQTPRAAKIVKSPAKIAWPNAVEFCESRTVRERGQSDSAISTTLFAVCESSEIPLKYPRRKPPDNETGASIQTTTLNEV